MMMATALIFPIALLMALGTIGFMLRSYGGKMMAALRMDEPAARRAQSLQPVRMKPRATTQPAARAPAALSLAA